MYSSLVLSGEDFNQKCRKGNSQNSREKLLSINPFHLYLCPQCLVCVSTKESHRDGGGEVIVGPIGGRAATWVGECSAAFSKQESGSRHCR